MQDKSSFPEISDKGVYCVIFKNEAYIPDNGRFEGFEFRQGYHVYVGSAMGSGGLKRLKRHVLLSLTKDKRPRWHVDQLLMSSNFDLVCVVYSLANGPTECQLAEKLNKAMNGNNIRSFGSSDCNCPSHLFHSETCPLSSIEDVLRDMGLKPDTICFR